MFKKISLGVFCSCFFFCLGYFYSPIFADTLVLKTGQVVEGKIIENTGKYVKIEFEGVGLTYFQEEIASINQGNTNNVANKGLSALYEAFKSSKNVAEDKEPLTESAELVPPNYHQEMPVSADVNVALPTPEAGAVNAPESMQVALSKLPKEYQEMIKSKLQNMQASGGVGQAPAVAPNDLSSLPAEYQNIIKSSLEKLQPPPQETKN